MMKKVGTNIMVFILVLLLIASCTAVKFKTNVEENKKKTTYDVFQAILCQYPKSKNNNYFIRKIVWNDNVGCGLIDISEATTKGGTYYPFLITKETQVIQLIEYGQDINGEYLQSVYNNFKQNHINLFSEHDFLIMKKRLDLGIISLVSPITSNLFSGNTPELDSIHQIEINIEHKFNYCKCRK